MARDVNRFETTADQQRGAEKSTPGRSTSRTSAATCAQHNDRRLPAWKIPQIVKTEPRRHSRKLPKHIEDQKDEYREHAARHRRFAKEDRRIAQQLREMGESD